MTENLRDLRNNLRLSINQLSEKTGFSTNQIRRWERGLELPSKADCALFEKIFNVNGDSILDGQRKVMAKSPKIGEGYVTVPPDEGFELNRSLEPPKDRYKVVDLFCGSGGFSHGFELQGQFAVAAGIDLLPDRVRTFHKNHRYAKAVAGDIRSYKLENLLSGLTSTDIVIGGPPCQGFSSIRPFRNLTELDQRNSLPEYFILALRELQPKMFIFENVVGLISHKRKAWFKSLLARFSSIGYQVDWRVINAASFGLPQNRERVIVVGTQGSRPFKWPTPTHCVTQKSMAGKHAKKLVEMPLFSKPLEKALTVMDAIHDLPPIPSGGSASVYLDDVTPTQYESSMRGAETILTMHEATKHSPKMLEIIRHAGRNIGDLPAGMVSSGFSSCYSRLDADKPSTTITVNFVHPSSNRCIHPIQDRALTPREGARLQGFPDAFEFAGSRAQVVKQIGNAVPPVLGKAIAEAVASHLNQLLSEVVVTSI